MKKTFAALERRPVWNVDESWWSAVRMWFGTDAGRAEAHSRRVQAADGLRYAARRGVFKLIAALAVVSVFCVSSSGEAHSPWVEARLVSSHDPDADQRATLWHEARMLLRERSAFPWEIESVRRSIARAPQFHAEHQEGATVWVTQLHHASGCLIGEPIVTSRQCQP